MAQRALFILTSHDKLGDTGKPTGFFWEELAAPYWALRDAGVEVDLASVKGGKAPGDPSSETDEAMTDAARRFRDSDDAMTALGKTLPVAQVKATDYDVVFLPGGHGTMWDLAQTPRVGEAIVEAWEAGAIVGAVCHGPAGLTQANLTDGMPLVSGKRVNGFTDAEEEAAGLTEVVPYLLESRLRELGAKFECNSEAFSPYAVADGRLITGQNPASSQKVAELILEALKDKSAAA